MKWCVEYNMWVDEIENTTGMDCPAKVFGDGCNACMNLKIIKGGKK